MKLKLNDQVMVIAGKEKGKSGSIIAIDHDKNRVKIAKLNIRTKHIKKKYNQAGEKITFEGFMDASNVMILDPKTNKPTRVAHKVLADGSKERVAKKSGNSLDTVKAESKSKKATSKVKVKA